MHTTLVHPRVLQAALARHGVWVVDATGQPQNFYHRDCWRVLMRGRPMPAPLMRPIKVR